MGKGPPFSTRCILVTPTLTNSYFLTSHFFISLDWFCARTVKGLLVEEIEHEGIGVPDRTKERGPGSDSSYHLADPF